MNRRYRYQFDTHLEFSTSVYQHSFKLRCIPAANGVQQPAAVRVEVEPFASLVRGKDAFGNHIVTGELIREQRSFTIRSYGIVETQTYRLREKCIPYYFCPSALIAADKRLLQLIDDRLAKDKQEQALAIADAVWRHMHYAPGITDTTTTASEAFALGKGVCQDFAHLMIALCRIQGIAARYVCGFMQGEGVTHAWVEIFDGSHWLAIDPTHNRLIDEGYIKLAHGRDANDCPVNRGVFFGNALQTTKVGVSVEEI